MTRGRRPDQPPTIGDARQVGRSIWSPHDRELVCGEGTFLADVEPRDALRAVFVRSIRARGTVRDLDASGARSMPGVVAVFTAAELGLPDLVSEDIDGPALEMRRPHLARTEVRFVGEALAVVVATDLSLAVDAAATVWADIEPVTPILDPRLAASDDDVLFPAAGTNTALRIAETHGPPSSWPVSVTVEAVNQRMAAAPLEPSGLLAIPNGPDALTVWCGHQAPHRLRRQLAHALGLAEPAIRVRVPDVGGAFGLKGMLYPEYAVIAAAAIRLRRPVAWLSDRHEELLSARHARGHSARLTLSGELTGRIRRADLEILADLGAYPSGADLLRSTRLMATGPYDISELTIDASAVVTDRAPIGSYRGAGRPEAAYVLERGIDAFARRLGLDPAVVRRMNLLPSETLSWRTPTGALYDGGQYALALDRALELIGEPEVRREQAERRAAGTDLIGLGIGMWMDRAGGDPDSSEYARVEVGRDGRTTVRTGSSAAGQGHSVVIRQVVADALQMPIETIDVIAGDTGLVPRGVGTFGSRSTQLGATAAHRAAEAVLARARTEVAARLEARPDDLRLVDGGLEVAGVPTTRVTLAEVARELGDRGEALGAEDDFNAMALTFPYGVFIAIVEVDVATGTVRLRDLVGVNDAGSLINPGLADGQVVGSAVQGLGQAMSEEIVYDPSGQLVTATFMDYLLPSAGDVPAIRLDWLSTPSPTNVLGVKGIGESGCIGVPQAIVNATLDALAPWGIEDLDMPLLPDRVWAAIRRAEAEGRGPGRLADRAQPSAPTGAVRAP
jgi:carbon-monoxide dehydrogenase large subunit